MRQSRVGQRLQEIKKRILSAVEHPVGVLDSGVGGLSVLRHIRAELPHESLVYCADSRYTPYGARTPEEIRMRVLALATFLQEVGAKAIVVACNTATAAAVDDLRARCSVPVIGMEPAVKPAAAVTRRGVVGVLATVGTLQSAQFAALLEHHGQGIQVVTQACHGLVECIERGDLDSGATRALVQRYVAPLLDQGADTLVLGCTHYPFVRPLIEAIAGPDVALVETGSAVARQLRRRLEAAGQVAPEGAGTIRFLTSGDPELGARVMGALWGAPVRVAALPGKYAG